MGISKPAVKHLLSAYMNENVSIFLNDIHIPIVDEDGNDLKISQIADGLVVDVDQDFIHLGLPDGMVTRSVPHGSVGMIELQFDGTTRLDEAMPMRDEDIN